MPALTNISIIISTDQNTPEQRFAQTENIVCASAFRGHKREKIKSNGSASENDS